MNDPETTASPRDLVLVLSGGNALGAFEAGCYEAIHEAGLRPDRVVGASIGAINGALIAGSAPDERLDALRSFWGLRAPGRTGGGPPPVETWRRSNAAVWTMMAGRPGLFGPALSSLWPWTSGAPSLYETSQMAAMLERLVDFERLNSGACRFAVTAVDVESGEDVVFDSGERRIDARHIRASAALPVLFPPVEIDGRWFVDGGLSANLPLDPVLAARSQRPTLCIAVDLVPLRQPRPRTMGEVASRSQDLIFGAQSRRTIARWQAAYAGRDDTRTTVLRVPYVSQHNEVAGKALDFSARTVGLRWMDGRRAMAAALGRLPDAAPLDSPGLTVLDEERGD